MAAVQMDQKIWATEEELSNALQHGIKVAEVSKLPDVTKAAEEMLDGLLDRTKRRYV